MKIEHELSIVEEKYRHIVSVLLKRENILSDGYEFYCGDEVIVALEKIAKEILGEGDNDGS